MLETKSPETNEGASDLEKPPPLPAEDLPLKSIPKLSIHSPAYKP
jgi:hypothetical protein